MINLKRQTVLEKTSMGERINREIFPFLAPELRDLMVRLPLEKYNNLEEIRLRIGAPALFRCTENDYYLGQQGSIINSRHQAFICTPEIIRKTVIMMCNCSVYALEEELQKGYLTLSGGHRVGFTGHTVIEAGQIKTLKQISSINVRVARFIPGASARILRYLLQGRQLQHTIIISPPRCGKTTILRDIVASISDGFTGLSPVQVAVVDERSEIAGCRYGVPQMPIGHCTDVLDACPKAEGMMMLVRSMGPEVIATDEIGSLADVMAVQEVINAGIKLIATAHGRSLEEVTARPGIGEIIRQRVFNRYIVLSRRKGPGTVESIYNTDHQAIWKGDGEC
ncbi:MAG: stage III sporulation protein AA [Bacillota bacterium]